jgi:hypothetical protein
MSTNDPADERLFLVDNERWNRFNEILSRPAEVKPRLAELLNSEPRVLPPVSDRAPERHSQT